MAGKLRSRVVAGALCVAINSLTAPAQEASQTQTAEAPSPHRLGYEASRGPGGNLATVVALEKAEQEFTGQRDMWLDVLATQLIFVGDHRKAAEFNAKAYARARPAGAESDGSELAGYEPRPAVEAILKLAEGRRVLMLNEEHRSSRERAFANELLAPLHRAGFTHLALETIGDTAEIMQRKYPLAGDGFYTQDPILGDLVRRAAEMGMGIVAYEADMKQMPADIDRSSPVATTNWRERQQAENLAAFLEANPQSRLVVWSGRHHMSEHEAEAGAADEGSWTPMGGIFKQLTGIDPLTVDLMVMNEQASPEAEHRTYRWASQEGLLKEPAIFMNGEGKPWSFLDSLDAAVFFARTQWHNGRPDWLRMGDVRTRADFDWSQVTQEKPGRDRPLVIEARVQGESEDAVPMDRVIWREGQAPPVFMRPGLNYVLQLRDAEGNVVAEAEMRQPGHAG